MNLQHFIFKSPNGYTQVFISKHHRGIILEQVNDVDPNIPFKSIRPAQLVYTLKEFSLLDKFRCRVFRILKQSNETIAFDIAKPNEDSLIDHAW